jgi:hypothetical protein
MIFVTSVHLEGSARHEHISSVRWRNPTTGATGQSTRAQMADWIRIGNQAYVTAGVRSVQVFVVEAQPPYIRTWADGVWSDNLLALPRY